MPQSIQEKIHSLVAGDDIKKSFEILLNSSLNIEEDLLNELRVLSARFNKNEKNKRRDVISNDDYSREHAKITNSLLQVISDVSENIDSNDDRKTDLTPVQESPDKSDDKTGKRKVFVSYNHKDQAVALRIKEGLVEQGFSVILDIDAIRAGEDIKTFIDDSVANSDCTLSLVSLNSLMSGWVGMETINTFFHEKFDNNKLFIACYLQDEFMAKDFVLKAAKKIDTELAEINALIAEHNANNLDCTHLNYEKTRYFDLRNNLDKIIARLKNSVCVDIRDDLFDQGMERVLQALQ